jgi:hypothetical protein
VCLADGTPIAVLAVSECVDCGGAAAAPAVSGWLNLTNGVYTPGAPPAGVQVCDPQQQFQVGQWCDLDGAGDVIAPVLVEYEYDENGQLINVRTLTPAGDPYAVVGTLGLCPQAVGEPQYVEMCDVQPDGSIVRFLRGFTPNGDGTANPDDIDVDGNTYTPTGTVGACEPCASSVQTTRLCDLNPDVEPDDQGRRCAVPFLRHMVYDCAGDLTATRDTTMDGVTPYTPVQVVDCQCGAGGAVPSLVELVWPQTDVIADPDGVADHDYIYLLTNPQTGDTAEIRLNTVTAPTAGTCGAWTPGNNVAVNAPAGNPSGNSRFTFTLDAAAQEMSSFRLDFLDLDPFEGVRSLTPPPDRVEFSVGAGTWTPGSGNISATVANSTAHAYWDNPPATITHLYANNGGGIACHAAALQGVTLIPGECCDSCACQDVDVETFPLCVLNPDDSIVQTIRAEVVYDAAGDVTTIRYVDAVDGSPVALPGGTHIGVCPDTAAAAEGMVTVLDECRCDDVAGDGSVIARYVELIGVNSDGSLTSLGYWTEDFTSPYDPVSPIPCPGGGATIAAPNPEIAGTLAHADGAGAQTVNVPAGARSITVTVHEGTADVQVGTDPVVALPPGSYTWAVDRGGPAGERLAQAYSVSGGAGDVFTVHSTREV